MFNCCDLTHKESNLGSFRLTHYVIVCDSAWLHERETESVCTSTCVCHMGYSCQCDIHVCASLSLCRSLSLCVNSLGYSVCLNPAKSLRIDQVGMQNLRGGGIVGEGKREEKRWRGWLWFNLNWLDKQGGEKQNKL